MIFRFIQKKIVLDCFTSNQIAFETTPICQSIKLIPDWWKNLSQTYSNENDFVKYGTTKNCYGIIEYYRKSISIPLWSDFAISIDKNRNFKWQFIDGITVAQVHNLEKQATGFLPLYQHLKIHSPWLFKEKEGIKWLCSHPTYNYQDNNIVFALPGVLNFKDQHTTNINIMIDATSPREIILNNNTPIMNLIPATDRKVEIKNHLVDQKEIDKLTTKLISFSNNFNILRKRKEETKKCPFNFTIG